MTVVFGFGFFKQHIYRQKKRNPTHTKKQTQNQQNPNLTKAEKIKENKL